MAAILLRKDTPRHMPRRPDLHPSPVPPPPPPHAHPEEGRREAEPRIPRRGGDEAPEPRKPER
jgi:hypothetical protein